MGVSQTVPEGGTQINYGGYVCRAQVDVGGGSKRIRKDEGSPVA
jgi:hypothetical protein